MAGIQTGHGATLTFGTSGFTASYTSIGGFEQSREALDTSHLGTTTYRSKIPGDLVDSGEFTATLLYDADVQPPITAVAETITIGLPDSTTGSGSGATIAASGFVTSWSTPEVATDTILEASVTVTWATGPTFTDET